MTNTVYFKVYEAAIKSFQTRKNNTEDIKTEHFFSNFKSTLTMQNFSIGIDEKIYRNQDQDGAIALPKTGIYAFELQMNCKNIYTPAEAKNQFKLYLETGFDFIYNGEIINDKPKFNFEITDKIDTLITLTYEFIVKAENDRFGVNFAPKIMCKNDSISLPFELFGSRFNLNNILITIKKEADLPAVKKNS